MTSDRRFQGLTFHKDTLYIAGGMSGEGECVNTVEVWDTQRGTSVSLPCLKYYITRDPEGVNNITCTISGNYLVIYGPYVSKDDHRHTLQLFSLSQRKVVNSMIVPKSNDKPVYSVVDIGNNRLLLVARDYTAYCRLEDILNNKPDNMIFQSNFVVPNLWCAVVISRGMDFLTLYGGAPKEGNPQHYIYTASIQDILQNASCGWTRIHGKQWPLEDYDLIGYDTLYI